MKSLIGIIVLVWLLIGAFAAFQRGYFGDDRDVRCKTAGETVLTIAAGPLETTWASTPQIDCEVPQPSN